MTNITTLINEADVLKIVSTTKHSKTHKPLLKSLKQHFPNYDFHLMGRGNSWSLIDGRLLGSDNVEIAPSWRDWLKEQYLLNGEDLTATVAQVQQYKYRITQYKGHYVFIGVKTGDLASDFIQLQIETITAEAVKTTIGQKQPYHLEDLSDLLNWAEEPDYTTDPLPIAGAESYRHVFMTNTSTFLAQAEACYRAELLHHVNTMTFNVSDNGTATTQTRVDDGSGKYSMLDLHPDYLNQKLSITRLFEDWDASSAGQSGAVFYEYWFLNFIDNQKYLNESDLRSMSAIPGWCTAKKLPVIKMTRSDTPYSVMDRLVKFDQKIGHPFAWYFFMLHGNRINACVGQYIAQSLLEGHLSLPAQDTEVLLNWYKNPYGF